jgi:4-hydroxy-3-methylbut-2-enyl diphosphate reductase
LKIFSSRYTPGFSPSKDLQKIGVVNQTTMLASETQEITDLLRDAMIAKYGDENLKNHIADTRDTLCYATNDNQSATYGLMENEADFAMVIGGYNSSNTTHLVELLETKFQTYFIESADEILSQSTIQSFDIHIKKLHTYDSFIPNKETLNIIITSGASCPDAIVDDVIRKMISFQKETVNIEEAIQSIAI